MCGLYGFIGKPNKQTSKIITKLGLLNNQRGQDSTGIAVTDPENTIVYKNAVDAISFFVDDNAVQKHLSEATKKKFAIIQGHTRAATRGAVTTANSHPFMENNIVFTHNGSISNFDDLKKEYNVTYDVDSQIIGYLLANKETVFEAFKLLSGKFSVPFVDMRKSDTLNVAIHSQVFNFATRGKQLYYSSTTEHLKQALDNENGFVFHTTGQDEMYTFYIVGNQIACNKIDIETKPYQYSTYDNSKFSPGYYANNNGNACYSLNAKKDTSMIRHIIGKKTKEKIIFPPPAKEKDTSNCYFDVHTRPCDCAKITDEAVERRIANMEEHMREETEKRIALATRSIVLAMEKKAFKQRLFEEENDYPDADLLTTPVQ